jgi:hypothetical protein
MQDSRGLDAFSCNATCSVEGRTSANDLSSPFLPISPARSSSGAGWESQLVLTMNALADSARHSYVETTRIIQVGSHCSFSSLQATMDSSLTNSLVFGLLQLTMAQLEQHFETSNNHMQLESLDEQLPGLQEESECAGRLAVLAREDAAAALVASDAAHAEASAAAAILATLTPQV